MKKYFYLLFTFFLCKLNAQLLPGIGLNSIPANSATICVEPFYLGSFYASGFQQGNSVPDFKLYGLNGDSLILSQALQSGPVLLIAGSLTCPVFRAKVATINQVVSTYSSNIKVYVIYTLEAHPTDTSVYFGYVNVTSQNVTAGILFPQPLTYGERKQMVDTMSNYVSLNAPVFIDGPCNTWWNNFGPAPNNSYLIGTNGKVLNKHGWFHKSPDDIFCDLDSILNVNSSLCYTTPATPGNFTINPLNVSVVGSPESALYDFVDIVNTSSVVVKIDIQKIQEALPLDWQSSFCADVCYGVHDSSIEITVAPSSTLHFSLDFYSGAAPDSGKVKVGFKNADKPSNNFSLWLRATTSNDVGMKTNSITRSQLEIYPNPAADRISLITNETNYKIKVIDLMGNEMETALENNCLITEKWPIGIYFIIRTSSQNSLTKKVVIDR
jgi:hypothetical protein